jgi:hypothetical protein
MGGSYRQCPQCGKRALSIATRCPGCGSEFPARAITVSGGGRPAGGLLTGKMITGVLAVAAVLAVSSLDGSGRTQEEQSGSVAADSVALAEVASMAGTAADTAEAVAPGELLVARDWTNVRKTRSVKGALEAMLMPGDTVLADSLGNGWYRVALEGEVLGYVHRSTLARAATEGRAGR